MTATLAGINDFFIRVFFRQGADSELGRGWGIDGLFMFTWWLSVFFFVLLMFLMVYWAIKYRRRPGVPTPRSPSHHNVLEITWSVVPTLLLAVIFFWSFDIYMKTQIAPGHAEKIDLYGMKWSWDMVYDNGRKADELVSLGGNDATPVFYIPAGKPVLLKMASQDVIHSFWVPDFRVKTDVMPNRYTPYSFTATEIDRSDPRVQHGTITVGEASLEDVYYRDHWVFCAEYCGDLHSDMAAIVRVVEPQVYEWWKSQDALGGTPLEIGEKVFQAKCAICHTTDGSAGVGPTWLNAYGYPREFSNADPMTQDDIDADALLWDNYIRESIIDPDAKRVSTNPAGGMVSFAGQLNDRELEGLIVYMKSLSDRGGVEAPPAEAPAETEEPEAMNETDGE